MEYPIFCVLGRRGSGKTLYMTYMAMKYHFEEKKPILCNFHLKGIPYRYITFEDIKGLPEWLNDSVLFLDEIQMWADSYDFLSPNSRVITQLATQIRKRRMTLFYSTQVFTLAPKRLRDQTNFIVYMEPLKTPGVAKIEIHDHMLGNTLKNKSFSFDGRSYFGYYDTNEIINPPQEISEDT